MVAVDQTIVATALPSIQADLHTRINWAGWTITIYSLAQVLAMPVAGKLSDQFGRKTIFMCAVAVFTTASLCCGLSQSIYLLIALRGVQALGGGASCRRPPASWPTSSGRTGTGPWRCSPASCPSAGSSGPSWAGCS